MLTPAVNLVSGILDMNAIILISCVLTGPVCPQVAPPVGASLAEKPAVVALVAAPRSTVPLGAGDALGQNLFSAQMMAGRKGDTRLVRVD